MNLDCAGLAVLFPGQGSQEKSMGRALAEASSEAMELWKIAEAASSLPLREIYWEGDEAAMANTRNLQPAMTAVNLGLWFHLKSKLPATALAGHSLGEYSALCASGVLSAEETLKITALRGRLMDEAGGEGGGMAAMLKLSPEAVADIVKQAGEQTGELLLIANHNSPGQLVISGKKAAVAKACELAKAQKGRGIELAVSGAFHSPLVAEAASELKKQMEKLSWNSPKVPVYFNATAASEPNPDKIKEIMGRQMVSPVLWIQTLAAIWAAGGRKYVELGPKGVLTKLLKPNFEGKDGWEGLNIAEPGQAASL